MPGILSSVANLGWRATLRRLLDPDSQVIERPSSQRPKYVHVRRRTIAGRKTRGSAYRQTTEVDEGGKKVKHYQRINDGGPLAEDEVQEYVTVKKSVLKGTGRTVRLARKKNEKRRETRESRLRGVVGLNLPRTSLEIPCNIVELILMHILRNSHGQERV